MRKSHAYLSRFDESINSAMAAHFTALPAFRGRVRFPSKQAVAAFHFGFWWISAQNWTPWPPRRVFRATQWVTQGTYAPSDGQGFKDPRLC